LSEKLYENLDNSVLISSLDIEDNINVINKYCNGGNVNIVFNNFQSSILLNDNKILDEYDINN
jgi:hypothetical protein